MVKKLWEYPFPKCEMDCSMNRKQMKVNWICQIHSEWLRKIVGDKEWNRYMEAQKELYK